MLAADRLAVESVVNRLDMVADPGPGAAAVLMTRLDIVSVPGVALRGATGPVPVIPGGGGEVVCADRMAAVSANSDGFGRAG